MVYEVTLPRINPRSVKSTGKNPAAENLGFRVVTCCTNNKISSFNICCLNVLGIVGISFNQMKHTVKMFSDSETALEQDLAKRNEKS